MEDLRSRHHKEQKDLQGRITQKKKNATKKTRKGVNDECERLQRELLDRQRAETVSDPCENHDSGSVSIEEEQRQEEGISPLHNGTAGVQLADVDQSRTEFSTTLQKTKSTENKTCAKGGEARSSSRTGRRGGSKLARSKKARSSRNAEAFSQTRSPGDIHST